MSSARMRPFIEADGSWNIRCTLRRRRRSSDPPTDDSSTPPTKMRPAVGRSSATIMRAMVDLPQPDSPTRPKVSPGATEKDTSAVALSSALWRLMNPPVETEYVLTTLCNSRTGPGVDATRGFEGVTVATTLGTDGCTSNDV